MSSSQPNEYSVLLEIVKVIGLSLRGNDRDLVDILRRDQLANIAAQIDPGSAIKKILDYGNILDGPDPVPQASARACHVIVHAATEDGRDRAAQALHDLGLNPLELVSTALTITYRVGSSQPAHVRDLLKNAAFGWTVLTPDIPDYLLHALCSQGRPGPQPSAAGTSGQLTLTNPSGHVTDHEPDPLDAHYPKLASYAGLDSQDRAPDVDSGGEPKPSDAAPAGIDRQLRATPSAGHAFISYVHEDTPVVDRMQRALESAGVRVWRDTAALSPGDDRREIIRHAITGNTFVFLACFSRHSIARKTSSHYEELALAIEQMRLRPPSVPWLIPVRLDGCKIPDHDIGGGRTLTSIHCADLSGDHFEQRLASLTTTVLRILKEQVG